MLRALTLLLLLASGAAHAQTADSTAAPREITLAPADSARVPDPGAVADTTRPALPSRPARTDYGVPLAPAAEGGLEQPVTFRAADSLRIVFAPRDSLASGERADDQAALFGEARAEYDGATLDAGLVEIFLGRETLRARPLALQDAQVGIPTFAQGDEGFTGNELAFNLRTRRGRIVGGRTQLDDGFLLAGVVKQAAPHIIYAENAAYTTCDLDHPHYAMEAGRIKVVDGKTVYTGPVRLRLLGIPTPLWLPFGFFPATEGRRSGPLAAGFGTSPDYGLFLEDLGYYWAVNDYLGAIVRGKIGTTGSIQGYARLDYTRRYAYDGDISLSYGRLRRGERDDLDFQIATPVALRWNHTQTFPAGQRLSADVDLQSSSARFVSDDLASQVRQSSTSTVSYAQTWPRAGRSLTVQLRANQQFDVSSAQLTLPSLSFSQQRRFPFKRQRRDGRGERWYEKIGVSYSGSATNAFSYVPKADSLFDDGGAPSWVDALFSGDAFARGNAEGERFAYGASHNVPISASFSVPRYNLDITPSVTYAENWVDERTLRALDPASGAFVETQEDGFFFDRRVRAELSLRTALYGTAPVRVANLDGLRHVLRPSVSLVAQPDFSAAPFNTVQVLTDTAGVERRFATLSGVPTQPVGGLRFSLDNAFLTRVVSTDSTGEESRRALQLLSLAISGGYNFAADERPIDNVSFRASAGSGPFQASASGSFSAYSLDDTGALTDATYLAATGRPVRLEALRFNAGWSLRSRQRQPLARVPGEAELPAGPRSTVRTASGAGVLYDPSDPDYSASTLALGPRDPRLSASFDLTAAYRPAIGTRDAQWTTTVAVNNLTYQLTDNWGLSGAAGFDVLEQEITSTQLVLRRDLHCWEMQIRWTPIGPVKAFSVGIYLKSGYLKDLLRLDLPNADFRSAFNNVGLPR
ncbi:putative LPS assembly protein LptD [Rubricoccus marinus]|uniref:LPS-assembly protein LptD central domain-containing protein n=1 Tax=Rubricoccus marinus TaxID=716817 RepID=A0A259TY10_9BACT|nr:putative LPS assembly protein LptD [Rubricoccus marinus]OZC02642.1 hypothetical protein BSZ36_06430 [Rubricoccus marinus]